MSEHMKAAGLDHNNYPPEVADFVRYHHNPVVADKNREITRLHAEAAELRAENEGLLKLDIRTLNAVVGRLEATIGSPAAVRILAMSFAAFLRENKGENFCTVDCVDNSDPENPVAMSVTVARKGGKSTAEVLAELRADLARVTGERDEHRSTLLTMESQIAMLEHEMYETPPGTYSPDGWTYKQAFTAEKARRIEAETARDAALAEVGRMRRAMENLEALFLDMRTPRNGETDRQLRTRIEAVSGNIHSAIALFRDPSTTAISFLTPPAPQQEKPRD